VANKPNGGKSYERRKKTRKAGGKGRGMKKRKVGGTPRMGRGGKWVAVRPRRLERKKKRKEEALGPGKTVGGNKSYTHIGLGEQFGCKERGPLGGSIEKKQMKDRTA